MCCAAVVLCCDVLTGNLLTMMGICISWQHFEALEHRKGLGVAAVARSRLEGGQEGGQGDSSGSTAYSRDSDKIDLYSLTLGACE